ncbi:MAG: hypothetical protein SFV54_13955 [Bryobacteraceae bacterium]|nr:hypothetical protein [Bryobacteraceae bacterium]
MRCRYCRREIGLFRTLIDRDYCCRDHRLKDTLPPVLAARESLIYGDDDLWDDRATRPKAVSPIGAGALMVVGTMVAAGVWFLPSGSGGAVRRVARPIDWTATFTSVLPKLPEPAFRIDFSTDRGKWLSSGSSDWVRSSELLRPGRLRVLRESLTMSDYQVEFEGQIQKKAMNYAFRAPDLKNYYACKIVLPETAGGQTEIVRMLVLDGREQMRARLPIPLKLSRDTVYRVKVNVRGDRFRTWINGQVVDSWADKRIARGGVGFFSEKGEQAGLKWVRVANQDSLLARMLSFATVVAPLSGEWDE